MRVAFTGRKFACNGIGVREMINAALAGFENYFRELGTELLGGAPDPQRLAALCARYALDMDVSSVPALVRRFGVRFPGAPLAEP